MVLSGSFLSAFHSPVVSASASFLHALSTCELLSSSSRHQRPRLGCLGILPLSDGTRLGVRILGLGNRLWLWPGLFRGRHLTGRRVPGIDGVVAPHLCYPAGSGSGGEWV